MAHLSDRSFLDSAVLARLTKLSVLARAPMVGSVSGIHRSAHRGSSVEFAEYRKYVAGDEIRHLDWRVYARTDRFYMKEFEADTNLRCCLVVDTSGSMAVAGRFGTKFEFARRLAATIAYMLARQGDAVGLTCFAERTVRDIPPRHTPSHLKHILDTLAEIRPGGKTEIVRVIHDLAERIKRRALVIVFSDFFTEPPPLLDCFQHMRFRKHDLAVFHLLDRQELDFGFDRPIRFTDMESSFHLLTDPSMIRDGYRRDLERYLADIRTGCGEFGVDYRLVVTDTDYEKVLSSFMLQRMRNKPR